MDRPTATVSPLPSNRLAELHHDLRSVLAAASLSLETARVLSGPETPDPKFVRAIDRALSSIEEALRIAEDIRAAERRAISPPAPDAHPTPAPEPFTDG